MIILYNTNKKKEKLIFILFCSIPFYWLCLRLDLNTDTKAFDSAHICCLHFTEVWFLSGEVTDLGKLCAIFFLP